MGIKYQVKILFHIIYWAKKIVITGGTSNLNGLSDLIARNITSNVRIGKPKIGLNNLVKFKNIPEELKNPRFSTVLGMALWAIGGILNETSDSSFEPEKIQKNDPYTYSLNTQLGFLIIILKDFYNNVKKISQQIIKNIIKIEINCYYFSGFFT